MKKLLLLTPFLLLSNLTNAQTYKDVINEYKNLEESVNTKSDEYKLAYQEIYNLYKDKVQTLKTDKYVFHWRKVDKDYYLKIADKNLILPSKEKGLIKSASETAHSFYYNHKKNLSGVAGNGFYAATDPFSSSNYGYRKKLFTNAYPKSESFPQDKFLEKHEFSPILYTIKLRKGMRYLITSDVLESENTICGFRNAYEFPDSSFLSEKSQICQYAFYQVLKKFKVSFLNYRYSNFLPERNGAILIFDQETLNKDNVLTLSRFSKQTLGPIEIQYELAMAIEEMYERTKQSYRNILLDLLSYFPSSQKILEECQKKKYQKECSKKSKDFIHLKELDKGARVQYFFDHFFFNDKDFQ